MGNISLGGKSYFVVAGLRVQHDDKVIPIPFFTPIENKSDLTVSRELSDQGSGFMDQDFEKHARQRGIHLSTSPAHQPQSDGVAERLVGLAKMCTRRLLLASSLPDTYWSYAMRFAAEMLRRKALRVITPDGWNTDAITTLAHPWKTIQTPEGKDLWLRMDSGRTQDSSRFIAEVESATATVTEDAKQAFWGEVTEPGNNIARPEVVEDNPPQDKPAQARVALTKTVPEARIIPNKMVTTTTGARYQATAKELQAFLKTAWKEPTPELPARYFAAKKKIVTQLLVFSLNPMT